MFRRSRLPRLLAAVAVAVTALGGCLDTSAVDTRWHTTSNVTDWRDEIVYQMLVDRFADGDPNNDDKIDPSGLGRYQGGDWQGVIDHVDYLEQLGITAVWISPVVRNVDTDANFDGYHGYWQQDMTLTNPHFGDLAKLREMVQKLHARKIKVILDLVTNHVGQLFYYDINKNGVPDDVVYGKGWDPAQHRQSSQLTRITEYDPDYDPRTIQSYTSLGESGPAPVRWIYDPSIHRMPPMPVEFQNLAWYNRKGRIVEYDYADSSQSEPGDQTLHGDFPGGLKDIKTIEPGVQQAFVKVFSDWIDKADFDGFRIDTLKHVEHDFWKSFCPGIRKHCKDIGKQNFFMFGEAFDGNDKLVAGYTGGEQVDSAFFFPQKFAVIDRVIKFGQEGTKAIENQFTALRTLYSGTPNTDGPVGADGAGLSAQQLMVNFLDNHDIPRFLYEKNSVPALHNALAFLFTEIGIPCVYYGTEQQFLGGNDPSNRERLWNNNGVNGFTNTGNPTFQWIHTLTELRKHYRPLRRGDLQVKWSTDRNADESDAGVFAFERTDGDKRALVVFNFSEKHASMTQAPEGGKMKVGFPAGTPLVNVLAPELGGTNAVQVGGDGSVVINLPPRSHKVFVAQGDAGGIP